MIKYSSWNWLMKVNIGKYKKNSEKKIKIEISKEDTWSLDYTLALIILPALKAYKEQACGKVVWTCFYPENYLGYSDNFTKRQTTAIEKKAEKEMEVVLDKMIYAFDKIVTDCSSFEEDPKIQEGLELFAQYYRGLWW